MLQQTQVKTVLSRYDSWLERFPSIRDLADASPDDVMKAWEGLGYYRRAGFIHQAARLIMALHGGVFPSAFEHIVQLPGIGRSTAGAIASFCFGAGTPVLDGNVKRVLRRWHAMPDAADKALWEIAQQEIDASDDAANWNQAMMELGAMICVARRPKCNQCPATPFCKSACAVADKKTPVKPAGLKDLHWLVNLHTCPERGLWLSRRADSGIWGGLWTPPISELAQRPAARPLHIHRLTHRRLHLYPCKPSLPPAGAGRWVAAIEEYALPTGIRRLLEKLDDE